MEGASHATIQRAVVRLIILNLQCACEASIGAAMHVARMQRLEVLR